ncbi:MAG: NADAR family protein [Treponema sp.]|jgi:ribA/ribD-fused uncharacterized protein|nr:NADAR family protein [Treponema sp.]
MDNLVSPFLNRNNEQKYTVNTLIEEIALGKRFDYVFFWRTDKNTVSTGCFSQWQESKFIADAYQYSCAEQYMMGQKALLFNDKEIFDEILSAVHPREIKSLGRKVKNFDAKIWDKAKYAIVLNGNFYKFTQNKEMMRLLVSTEHKVLVEASPVDTIWGVGLAKDDKKINDPNHWKGENLLGFALMEVREEIKKLNV